ncbi:tRNA dihydrouridine synthase DusB [Paraflavitalea sp. CAU 1676]|uniref:tRNA dihydrouridine synthase DusB n=1 Tax=Paraflavitalea sp. CAU 1676 TaxID=3032598 RepID=UPI0023DC0F96|nr:tRNA dihydrouridine synthase DusB [Paraflavitalea sp. CAU 1676]MDF2188020.1 tRNA dihydrouridine synthase DusB [Paraflavitalea sp. CAU 1676]
MVKISHIELPDFPLLLAPMEDVSDPPFRVVCKDNGADLLYTEFISSEGLIKDAIKAKRKLDIFDEERPVGIQIFGGDEERMAMAARIVDVTNPDLLDINFGCPIKGIVSRGAGAGVLKDIDLMVRLTEACVKSTRLPVTVKTRLGWDDNSKNIEEVAERLQDTGIKALAIHGRTRCQLYKGEADWSLIAKVKNNPRIHIPIFGNGDINTPQKALEYKNRYGVDGIMVGRAAIGYPWIFREIRHYLNTGEMLHAPTLIERVEVSRKQLRKSVAWKGPKAGIYSMRRQYLYYFKGLPGFSELRQKLVTALTIEEAEAAFDEVLVRYEGYEFEQAPIVLKDYHENCAL